MVFKKFLNDTLKRFNLKIVRLFPRSAIKYSIKGKNLIGAEIGICRGEHSRSILNHADIKKLYLVDSYKSFDGTEKDMNLMKRRLKKYSNKLEFIKKDSSEAIKHIPNNLDFVYIDGNHTYKYVKEDIKNYYPKLKNGGILAGHDFNYMDGSDNGVIKAVVEFATKNNLAINFIPPDWWLVKDD